jgi:glyoxylase I family protein
MDVLGLDHVYLSVSDMERSERFYDAVMRLLGFHKGDKAIGGDPHAHYFNRTMQISIRPARSSLKHDPYAPGLHHFCLQLATPADVDAAVEALRGLGVETTEAARHPEYNPDYYATFFEDPDGLRLELVARTPARDAIVRDWDELEDVVNPVAALQRRRRSA